MDRDQQPSARPKQAYGLVTIKQVEPDYKTLAGSDGDSIRVRTRNGVAEITLTLLHSSPANFALSAFRAAGLATGEDVGPFGMTDQLGGSNYLAAEAWIQTPPEAGFGADPENRVYVFGTGRLEVQLEGGAL